MKPITHKLTFESSTKGTHIYVAPRDKSAVTKLYIDKKFMEEAPKEITLTIK